MPPKRPQIDDDVRLMDGRRGIVTGIAEGEVYGVLIDGTDTVVRVPLKGIAGIIQPGFRAIDR